MKIRLLTENLASDMVWLAEWGFSAWIEYGNHRITRVIVNTAQLVGAVSLSARTILQHGGRCALAYAFTPYQALFQWLFTVRLSCTWGRSVRGAQLHETYMGI